MFNSISFNLQFSNFYCNSYSFNEKGSNFDFVSTKDTSEITCPFCGSKVHIYDNSTVRLKDMPMFSGVFNSINISIHRYRCTSCNSSFSEELPFKHPGTRITNRLANYIKSFLKHRMSIKDISEITGVHRDTISKIHKAYMKEELNERAEQLELEGYRPKFLAVDEFTIHKGHTYATCVMDLETGEVIWVGKGRAINDFRKFFNDVSAEYLSEAEAVAAVCYAMKEELTRLFNLTDVQEVVKRIGYGYRNDEHFFTMIKYLSIPSIRSQSPRNPC